MKIGIIGAGQGGLQAGKVLALSGIDVTIFEKSARDELGHDQLDVTEHGFFDEIGVPVPEKAKPAAQATFVGPDTESCFTLNVPDGDRDWSIERRIFSREQVERCEKAGVKFCFNTTVNELITDRDRVIGFIVEGEKFLCDLVIDSSGVSSPLRRSFKGKYGLTEMPKENEIFNIVHTYYEPKEGIALPEKYKYYLKFGLSNGICWCGIEVDGSVSTLIGNIGSLPNEEYERLFALLKENNPIISDKALRGGHSTQIPVRYPAPIMVSEGYATVGDSAFMTIPLLGNGIVSSVRAGQILAEKILENGNADIATLWQYEVEFFKKYGAFFCFIDCIKRGLLKADNDEIKYFFESEIIRDEDLAAVFSGKLPKISPKEFARKVKNLFTIKHSLGIIFKEALKGSSAMLVALEIPAKYDPKTIYPWKQRLENIFNS